MIKTINILGVTGSIGQAAMDVVLANPGAFKVNLITAHSNAAKLEEAQKVLGAKRAFLANDAQELLEALEEPVDVTVCAIAGMAGLTSMLKAIRHSKIVAIANKEPLVAAGRVVLAEAKKYGTILLPIDSEHNAIYQVFEDNNREAIEKIILTASGGPFRTWSVQEMQGATREQALKHPNWSMGHKVTIDSATMANKALEIIEAHYLFAMPAAQIGVLIHPQSIIHSMVEYKDGSVLAQMGASDMRTPIAHVLGYPERINSGGQRLDFKKLSELTFEQPDLHKFPFLRLAYECLEAGEYACVALNAANEVAVEAFLTQHIGFGDIVKIVEDCLDKSEVCKLQSLDEITGYDQLVRRAALEMIHSSHSRKKAKSVP